MSENRFSAGKGTIFVVSAPSGAGKHTLIERLVAADPLLELSISATTREPRPGERMNRDYFFMTREEFLSRVEAGDFVEHAEVHGNLYGTLREELDRKRALGKDVILQIDVQGMRNLKTAGLDFVSVFIMAPTLEELERRLRHRGTDSPEAIAVRMANAKIELDARHDFDHVIVNEEIEQAVADFEDIIQSRRCGSTEKG